MKFVGFALVCAFILFGCDTATNPDDTQPPGGGEVPIEYKRTVFYEDSTGAYREVSAVLGTNVTWEKAKELAEEYTGGGYTDWYLPTPAELNQLYNSGEVAKEGSFWSSEDYRVWITSTNFSTTEYVWVCIFGDALRSTTNKSTSDNSVRAVRSHNPKTYSVGDEGPGGGTIYWVDTNTNSYKEVSDNLGEHDWGEAISTAEAYSGNGFRDWYLPNVIELNELYINKDKAGITEIRNHRSSSRGLFGAWVQHFYFGEQKDTYVDSPIHVRAIRSFNTSAP